MRHPMYPRPRHLLWPALAAFAFIGAALIAQEGPDSQNPTREHQPPALKDAEEMQSPGIRRDGVSDRGRASDRGAMAMSEPMRLRCRMLMMMEVDPYGPAALLAVQDELKLSDEQVNRLREIHEQSVAQSKSVLNDRQQRSLAGMADTPNTSMKMHRRMMQRRNERTEGTTEEDTRKDGRSARRSEERPRAGCPMVRAMREMEGGRARQGEREERDTQRVIDVVLRDFAIDMPETLPRGIVKLRVKNEGARPHNIEVEGQGIEEKFASNLSPGETRVLHVHLKPGTYEVYCPVGNHAERGMRMALTVAGPEDDR